MTTTTAPATFAGTETTTHLIAGTWRAGSSERVTADINPWDGSVLTEIRQASTTDVDDAYEAARKAQPAWAALTPAERQAIMYRAAELMEQRRDEIVDWLIAESGSTRSKANLEVTLAVAITRESASFPARTHGRTTQSNTPGKENRVYRVAKGVIGVISPWNFPYHLSIRSVAPALALGNAVVIKPASDTMVTGGIIPARIFEEAGVPAGVISTVAGAGSEIGDHFVTHPVPALISFTGSTPVGRRVGELAINGGPMKQVALELGGNAPLVVLDDADLDAAVQAAAVGSFLHQGQICMAVNRIIVDQSLYEEFLEKFEAAVKNLPVGDPSAEETFIGPVINDSQLDGLKKKIETANREGARTVLAGPVEGRLVHPHIFADVTPDMEIAREEIFGPLVGVLKAQDEEHAAELANDTEFGLSAAVFTTDLDRGAQFGLRIEAGMVQVNDLTVNDEPHVMFGGAKNSGLGRFNGDWAIEEFTTDRWIGVKRG
ncbi:aldehyde dehydrogenase family protein [Corynebacterium guangdongense]|uniref:Aldehyde dehydrogenase (NAD+) n=1 Tax=Corynebacterium guangdongense TaxID=1783348 RepID=A0ABU1ZY62_9CORY|nr:aldehyde dehydrogenase family protein [Corynebacterium guangdongense]MDR7329872.1 aldehyde dehydrogenase (NAD+) [Corynebacterium guangdongense]WJZ18435.1 Putative aldehyde dehydrogenase YfmT [Corynebacterium guangdongense]